MRFLDRDALRLLVLSNLCLLAMAGELCAGKTCWCAAEISLSHHDCFPNCVAPDSLNLWQSRHVLSACRTDCRWGYFSKRTKKAQNLNPLKQMCCTKYTFLHCKSGFIEPCYTFFNGKRIIEHIYSKNLVQHEAFRHYSAYFWQHHWDDWIIRRTRVHLFHWKLCTQYTGAVMNAYEPTTAS